MLRVALLALALAAAAAACAGVARAHTELFRRAVHVRVLGQQIDAAMAVGLHPGPEALRIRERFDVDADSVLSRPEQDAMLAWFEDAAWRDFGASVDGVPIAWERVERELGLSDDRVEGGDGIHARFVRSSALCVRPGGRELVVRDAPANGRDMIPVRVDLPAGVELAASEGQGGASKLVPAEAGAWQALVTGEPGALVLRLRVPARSAP